MRWNVKLSVSVSIGVKATPYKRAGGEEREQAS